MSDRIGSISEVRLGHDFLLASPPASLRAWDLAEENAQFVIDLVPLLDEPSCTRELVVEHNDAFLVQGSVALMQKRCRG